MVERILRYSLVLLVGMGACTEVWAQRTNAMRAPVFAGEQTHPTPKRPSASYPAAVLDVYLRFFQRVISPVDGARSNMYPTGSDYARQAFAKHGALVGVILTTERLMHEGNEARVAPRIRKYGLWRIFDPVAANDWWWRGHDWVYMPSPGPRRR